MRMGAYATHATRHSRSAAAYAPIRMGILNETWSAEHPTVEGLKAGLRDLGLEEGRDVTFEVRFTEGRREATGRGVAFLVGRAMQHIGWKMAGATAIIQGFGNVGSYAAETLAAHGMKLTGVSDHSACYFPGRIAD